MCQIKFKISVVYGSLQQSKEETCFSGPMMVTFVSADEHMENPDSILQLNTGVLCEHITVPRECLGHSKGLSGDHTTKTTATQCGQEA